MCDVSVCLIAKTGRCTRTNETDVVIKVCLFRRREISLERNFKVITDQSQSKRTMLKFALFATLVAVCAAGKRVRRHETDTGECPTFPPMQGFDYDRVS